MTPIPYAWMGILCLGIVWTCALLIAGAALQDVRALLATKKLLGPKATSADVSDGRRVLLRGKVTGRDGVPFATHTVQQVGRAKDGATRAVVFFDRAFASSVGGGTLGVGASMVSVPTAEGAHVWPDESATRDAFACPDATTFEATHKASRGPKGALRDVTTPLTDGAEVWISGVVSRESGAAEIRGDRTFPLVVSAFDPHAWIHGKVRAAFALIVVELALLTIATAVTLVPPAFGTVSTLGGVLCLAFFLGVQPFGVMLRDACRLPHERYLRGEWTDATAKVPSANAEASVPS
ncbi:MAG: hypothetical protein U0169_24470 [Polyangiaceae bacterium]